MIAPVLVFNLAAFALPLTVFGLGSVRPYGGPAEFDSGLTTQNWEALITDPQLRTLFVESLALVVAIVIFTAAVGFPISYVIARSARWGTVLLFGVIASSFLSAVVQTLGWLMLLGGEGPINVALRGAGLSADGLDLLQTRAAVIAAMIHVELHYMVLVCTPAIMSIPRELEDAAAGLGASWSKVMRRVVVPLSWPGIVAGSLLVMATAAGSFTTPAILGGGLVPWIPVYIYNQMQTALNYPAAATASVALVLIIGLASVAATLATRRLVARSR
ncbi:ABC transporter permease [Egibacter rhizosphaerae]|uniref:ABC transporter permease n=1 Tax=Egibacter rhizosphaerae TaxID=1670831 RepID=UPI0013F17C71|nr:ABC transporter permease [Egibacter rhizosphaerae]